MFGTSTYYNAFMVVYSSDFHEMFVKTTFLLGIRNILLLFKSCGCLFLKWLLQYLNIFTPSASKLVGSITGFYLSFTLELYLILYWYL